MTASAGDAAASAAAQRPAARSERCVTPCGSCPWRVGAVRSAIPGFDPVRARSELVRVADRGEGDAFRPVMACHLSSEGVDRPCVGYVVSADGFANLAVRLAAATGDLPAAEMVEACVELELHDDFSSMLDALFDAG